MTENILACSQLTAFYSNYLSLSLSLSLSLWKSRSWLRAVVNLLLTDIKWYTVGIYFILSSNCQWTTDSSHIIASQLMPGIKWTTDSSQLTKSASSQLTLFTPQLFVWIEFSIFEFYHLKPIEWSIGLNKGDKSLCRFC